MMRAIVVILVASALAFLAWQFMRPDPQMREDTTAEMIAAPSEETGADMPPQDMEQAAEPEPTEPVAAADPEEPLPEVITLTVRADEIAALYENAPWVHRGLDGPVLYVVSFRTCTTSLAFKQAELHGLEEAGVDVRWIIYTRRDREGRQRSSTEERAVQAELWLNRDWDLFEDWYAVDPDTFYVTSQLPPVAEEDPARAAAVEEARALVETLSDLYAENGVDLYIPSLLWQEDGIWKTYVGYEETSFAPVRAALTGE